MPPNTNRGLSIGAGWAWLGGRKLAAGSCRDQVAAALSTLSVRCSRSGFSLREVYAEMVAAATFYAESTVFKTMQRMKKPASRAAVHPPGKVMDAKAFAWRRMFEPFQKLSLTLDGSHAPPHRSQLRFYRKLSGPAQ